MATLEPLRHAVATQEGLESSSGADVYRIDGTLHFGETTYITPCLTRISDGETIWASRYRYTQEEGFDAVVRIVSDVVAALQIKLTEGEQAGIWRARTASVEAWECFQRAHHLERRYRPDLHQRAVELYERSLRLDGSYVVAIAALGFCLLDQYRLGWNQDATSALKRAEALAEQALALDPDFPDAVALRGFTLLLQGQTDEALAKARRAIDLAPQSVEMIAYFGAMLRYIGRADDAVATYRRAIRLSPHPAPWLLVNMGNAYLEGGRLFEAIAAFGQITDAYPDHLRAHLGLVIAYMRSGRIEDAQAAAQTACRIEPTFVASEYTSARAHSDPAAAQALIDDLVAAGLPRDR
jgi:tetratricopeptide (TPR) repeat protein